MVWYIVSSIVLGLAGLILYVYYLRKGQFDDLEDVKYQLLRDEETQEPGARGQETGARRQETGDRRQERK